MVGSLLLTQVLSAAGKVSVSQPSRPPYSVSTTYIRISDRENESQQTARVQRCSAQGESRACTPCIAGSSTNLLAEFFTYSVDSDGRGEVTIMPTKPMHVVHHVNTEIACLAWTVGIGLKYGPNAVPPFCRCFTLASL